MLTSHFILQKQVYVCSKFVQQKIKLLTLLTIDLNKSPNKSHPYLYYDYLPLNVVTGT